MAYASRSGRARTNPSAPRNFSVCQRCGLWYNFSDLTWQFDYRGATLQNLRLLVCTRNCLDRPQPQLKVISLPADPVPVPYAIPETFFDDET